MVTDLDQWIRKAIQGGLEKRALGDAFSFVCGPTYVPGGTGGVVYAIVVSLPSPVIGETLSQVGLISIPINTLELEDLLDSVVDTLRQRRSASLGVGFPPPDGERTVTRGIVPPR